MDCVVINSSSNYIRDEYSAVHCNQRLSTICWLLMWIYHLSQRGIIFQLVFFIDHNYFNYHNYAPQDYSSFY